MVVCIVLRVIEQGHDRIIEQGCERASVVARKLSSKFNVKVSRNFWHESLNLFEETFR